MKKFYDYSVGRMLKSHHLSVTDKMSHTLSETPLVTVTDRVNHIDFKR